MDDQFTALQQRFDRQYLVTEITQRGFGGG